MAGKRSPISRERRPRWVRWVKRLVVLTLTLLVFVLVAGFAVYYPIDREAHENVQTIDSKLVVLDSNPSIIYASDGSPIYRISLVRRNVIDVMKLPDFVRYAMLAAEDKRFYDHRGVDLIGLFRSVFTDIREGHKAQGGSTLEMQLAKKLVNGDERSFTRKLKDIATAQEIENLKSKDQILNLYMNEVYYGEGAYGIEAAADTYFSKPAKDLTLSEAAMLARCVRTPTRQNPIRDYEGSLQRRNDVLKTMLDEHWITNAEYDTAVELRPKLNPNPPQGTVWVKTSAGYFVDSVINQFKSDFPGIELQEGGYKVYTTLNMKLQNAAVGAVKYTLGKFSDWKVNDAAFVATDSDGKILAEVGGPNYNKVKFNVITQGERQPGSSFKPFVYATAFKQGVYTTPDQGISNAALRVWDNGHWWEPKNNGHERIGGTVSIWEAFEQSMNLPAIHTAMAVTPAAIRDLAYSAFGFRSKIHAVDSLGIGTSEVNPLEMAEGYSVFMLKGDRVRPYSIERVVGPDGSVVKEYAPQRFTNVLDPGVCSTIDELMQGVVQHGTGWNAHEVPDARGKTGTTQDAKDAWFCGYSDGVLGVGWVGHTVYKHGKPYALPMKSSVFGGTVTCIMWAQVLQAAHSMGLAKPPAPPPSPTQAGVAKSSSTTATPQRPELVAANSAPPLDPKQAPDPATRLNAPTSAVPGGQSDPNQSQAGTDSTGGDTTSTSDSDPPNNDQSQAPQSPPPPPPRSTARPPRTRVSTPPKPSQSDYVEVQICADTGLRATIYCPETVTRRFLRGTEPKKYCTLHHG